MNKISLWENFRFCLIIWKIKTSIWFRKNNIDWRISVNEIALMGLFLTIFAIIKYVVSILFIGPLNIEIQFLFWILSGIIFGPFKGAIFSTVCDFLFLLFSTRIAFWMIEYQIVPPLVSIVAWFFYTFYRENSKFVLFFSLSIIFILVASSIIIFLYKLNIIDKPKNVFPIIAFSSVLFLNFFILCFTSFCLISFCVKKKWEFIKWLYLFSLVIFIIIIFRWLWGTYSFIRYLNRFVSKNIDITKQFPLTLTGIAIKSFISVLFTTVVLIPIFNLININKKSKDKSNKY